MATFQCVSCKEVVDELGEDLMCVKCLKERKRHRHDPEKEGSSMFSVREVIENRTSHRSVGLDLFFSDEEVTDLPSSCEVGKRVVALCLAVIPLAELMDETQYRQGLWKVAKDMAAFWYYG